MHTFYNITPVHHAAPKLDIIHTHITPARHAAVKLDIIQYTRHVIMIHPPFLCLNNQSSKSASKGLTKFLKLKRLIFQTNLT